MKTQFFVLLLVCYLEMSLCSVKKASALSLIQKSTVRLHELKVDIDKFSSSKSSSPSATATAGPLTVKADSKSVNVSLAKSSTTSSSSVSSTSSVAAPTTSKLTSAATTSSATASSVTIPSVTTASAVSSSVKTVSSATSAVPSAKTTTPLKLETTKVVVKAMGDIAPDAAGDVSNEDICSEAKILDSLLIDIDGVVAELTDALNDHMSTLLKAKKDSVEDVDRNKWAAWAGRVLEFFIAKVNELRTILDGISAANLTAKNNHCITNVQSSAKRQITIFLQNIEAAAKKLGFGASYVQNKLREMNSGKKTFLGNNKLKH